MLLLGLLLMAASGAFVGLLIADNLSGGPDYQATILGTDFVTINSLGIFLSGVALALIFCLGLVLVRLASKARWRARTVRRSTAPDTAPTGTVHRAADPAAPAGPADAAAPEQRAAAHGGRIRHRFGH